MILIARCIRALTWIRVTALHHILASTNYSDKEMLAYPYWPQLYHGDRGLYSFLQGVKRRYDPNNVFHHAMPVRP
jgi:hypothetical protein